MLLSNALLERAIGIFGTPPSVFYLLNHRAEFDQTCYITSPHGTGEQYYIFVRPFVSPSICPSRYLLLAHWAESNQTCYTTSPHGKGVREQHYFFVRPSVHASVVRPSVLHAITSNHWTDSTKLATSLPIMVSVARATLFFSVRPSFIHLTVTLSIPKQVGGIQPNLLHLFPSWQGCARATLFFCAFKRPSVSP